jgi:outer membrane protein TolC
MIGAGFNYMIFSPRTGNDQMAMGGQNMLMPMVSVTIPINRKRYGAMGKEAELLREAAQYEQTGVRNLLSVQWDEAIRDLDNAERRIRLYREQETLAGQTLRLITTAYSAEGAGFEEVLRVQQQLIDYRLNLIQAVVDQNKTIARIEMLAAININ